MKRRARVILELKGVLLGGSWEIVTTYNWGYITLLEIGVTPIRKLRGVRSRVISPVISSY